MGYWKVVGYVVHTYNVRIAFVHTEEESLTGSQNCDPIWLFIHASLCKAKNNYKKKVYLSCSRQGSQW